MVGRGSIDKRMYRKSNGRDPKGEIRKEQKGKETEGEKMGENARKGKRRQRR